MVSSAPANADDLAGHCCVDWNKLNLTQTQSQQIDQLNGQWSKDYNEIKPVISDDQQKLQKLLADHNSDPVEVMALQQQIARKREQLNGLATANYLRKRQVLNENQQFNLEQMIKAMVAKRQAQLHPNQHTETVVTDRIQNLMNRARNIWPVQAER
jgi:Spy/CpxP family protein refolding chaperone